MKKIITLSMIKNEADIVEVFVRYTMNFASKMFFIDNGCSDGSIEILKALATEGFNIEIYTEAQKFYDQFLLENQYIRKIVSENEFDFLIPLDLDEFLASDTSLLKELEKLPCNAVTILNWKTYCICSKEEDGFLFDRIRHIRKYEDKTFTKVILPLSLLQNNNIFVTMGHHDVECKTIVEKVYLEGIFIAHFPVRSMEQIRLKIYQGIISQLMSCYHKVVAFQWKRIHEEIKQDKFNLVKYSMEYALPENQNMERLEYIDDPFDYSWCSCSLEPKYLTLRNLNTLDIIYEMLQVVAIKSVIGAGKGKIKILIYGTGKTAETLFDFIRNDKYDILAYVDSDVTKEYSQFQNRLIIAPDKIKYIEYDRILIASKFWDEIYEILLNLGVDKNKITNKFEMIEEQLEM